MITMHTTRRVAAHAALLLILAASCCGAAEVRLVDGRTLTGTLRPIDDASYLLQTDDALFELTGSQIREVDGRRELPPPEGSRLVRSSCYEVLHADGSVEAWNTSHVDNDGRTLLTSLQWGAAPHEMEKYRTLKVLDPWGNTLRHRFEPRPGTDIQNVIVDLAVPVLPGESVEISTSMIRPRGAVRDGDVWTCTFPGDFPDDRLYSRMLRLPPGAEVVSVEPEVRVHEHDGASFVSWRRYYPKGSMFPLTVKYRLPD
jgi:hypothetical protein